MALELRPNESFITATRDKDGNVRYTDIASGRAATQEEYRQQVEAQKAEENKSLFDRAAEIAGNLFTGETTQYEQAGALDNAINGRGRGVDEAKSLFDANSALETDSERAARLREAANIIGFDGENENLLMQTGMDDNDLLKSALALAKKKQSEPDDWEQFAAEHPATIKYLEQQKNMAISYDDVKPLGRLEDTANQVKNHLEMMEVEEKIAELGRKYDAQNMSYNELSADQRVELNDLLAKRKELAGNVDTWSVGNVLGSLLVMKEDLPMALMFGLQGAAIGAGAGALGAGIGAVPGAFTGFGAGFRVGMGASMGQRLWGTQYAENMMRADANGQYMDARALRQGAQLAGAGMAVLGTVGVGRLTSKLPMGQVYDKFLRSVSPAVLNNPAAREVAWKGYLSTLGTGLKEAAIQDVIFGGGTAALTFGANRYSEAWSGLDYSNREDGTLIDNIINGMEQFAPLALGTGVGFTMGGKLAGKALSSKKPYESPPMPVADGLNKVMNAVDETKTAQRSPQATRDMINTVFGETASSQDVEINAQGLVRLFQEADPDNPNKVVEVAQRLGVDEKTLMEAAELGGDIRVSVGDFVKEFGLDKDSKNLRAEVLKEVRDVDGVTENERGKVLSDAQRQMDAFKEWLQEQKNAQYDHNDPAYIAAMDIAKAAYPNQPKNQEQQANIIYAGFKGYERLGVLKLAGFENAEQAIRAVEVRRKEAPDEQAPVQRYNMMSDEAISANIEKGRNAVEKVIQTKSDVPMAMHRDDIGDIEIVWGKEGNPEKEFKGGFGISHIIAHRNAQGFDGLAIARKMPEIIMNGKVVKDSQYKATIEYDGHWAILAKNKNGTPSDPWLLTGYNLIENGEPSSVRREGFDSSTPTAHTPTQSRRMGEDGSPVKDSIPLNQSAEKSVINDTMQTLFQKADTQQEAQTAQAVATDKEYFSAIDAVNNAKTDEEKGAAQQKLANMVENAAKAAGFENAIPEQTVAYKTRTTPAPKKTLKVYKVFTVAADGSPTALFVGGTEKLPQGVWLDAMDTYHFQAENGSYYVPSTKNPNSKGGATGTEVKIPNEKVLKELQERGYVDKKAKVGKAITALAYRPGWHAGTLPFFPQGGTKIKNPDYVNSTKTPDVAQFADTPYPNVHRYNQVVFECELAFDKDYNEAARATKDGDLEYLPKDGSYYFATNPLTRANPELGAWVISGSLKIGRALTKEECDAMLEKQGMAPQQWEGGELRKGTEEERQAAIDNYMAEQYAEVDENGKHKKKHFENREVYQKWYDKEMSKYPGKIETWEQKVAEWEANGKKGKKPKKPTRPKAINAMASGYGYESGPLDLESLGYTGQQYDAARKTLAPITYDEQGNVIPLSQRFNPDIDNVLYQEHGVNAGEDLASIFTNAKTDENGKLVEAMGHAVIELYKNANPSSLAHEMLHHWVTLNELAYKTGKMEGQALEDFAKLAEFAGHELGTEWSRDEHEMLASAWETYLSEGRAPSLELVGTFDRFKQWMKKIYQTLVRHAVPINDDVRGVFDRMLAADKELALAEDFYMHEELFAGREMNETAKREYIGMLIGSHEEAQREMDKRVMAEVKPAMKEIEGEVTKNLREDIAGKMMNEPVYVARSLLTAPVDSPDFQAAKANTIREKLDERLDLLVRESAKGVENKGMIAENAKQVSQEWFGGFSDNHDWYKEMFARRGGKIPGSWYRFIKAYKAGEKTLKQMPKTMREEYEYIANEQLTNGHKDNFYGDIPEDMEYVNLKEGTPAMSFIVQNGGGIRLDRASVYERYGKGALQERWLTDKNGYTLDELADYVYEGKAGGDMLYNELTTKPTFAKELAKRVRAGLTEFKDNELGTLRESAIKAIYNEKSMDAVALRAEVFERMAAEKKAKEQQKTAEAMAEGRERSKWENKVEAEKQKGQEAVSEQKLVDDMYYGRKMAEAKADSKEALENQKLADEMHFGRKMAEQKREVAERAAREQRWLDAAISRGTLKAKAAREMARQQIAETPVGEVMKWQKYTALANRARKESIRAMSKGDYEAALEATNRELLCHAMAKAAADADKALKSTMNYFGRINRRGLKMNKVPHAFNVQIDNLLAKYNLLTREPLKPLEGDSAPQLSQFIKDCEENYFVPVVSEDIVNGQPMHYTRLTFKEIQDLKQGVKSLQHVGRQMDATVANAKKQSITDICQSLVEQLATHTKRYAMQGEMGQADVPTVSVTSLVKAETLLRLMDKGEENGVFVRNLYNPIKLGLDDYANRSRKIVTDWDKVLADSGWTAKELYKQKNVEHTFDFMPNPKISHEQVILSALNWGNEGNRDRLRYYFMTPEQRRMKAFTPEQLAEIDGKVMQMFEALTAKDLKLIQAVWDYLETYAPEIRKHEVEVAGVDVKMVEPTAFTVMSADGQAVQMRGGYFPIRYDSGRSTRALDLEQANQLYKQNSAVTASTAHGHVKARTQHMNRPLLLEWNTLLDHLRNVNYDLAMRKPIMDVSRILRNEDVQSAIAETFGNEKVKMLQDWVRDIATDQREDKLTFAENAMRWTRTRMSVAYLGFRTKALVMDLPQNFITGVWQNGVDETIKGISQFYLTGDYRQKIDFMNARSPMMRDKISFMDANLADLRVSMLDQSIRAKYTRFIQKFAFCCDLAADMAVNAPMWLRFHAEAMKRGLTDAEASLEADAKTRRMSVDTSKAGLSAIQRGGEFKKLVTPFYSYFNAFFNRLYFDYGMAKIKWTDGQQMDAAKLMVRTAVLGVLLPSMIEAIVQVAFSNDKEKDEKKRTNNMIKEAASAVVSYNANTVPVLGPMFSYGFDKAIGKKYVNYELSPIESAVESVFGVPAAAVNYVMNKDVDKEAGEKLLQSVGRAASILAPYPNMINTLALNIWDVISKGDFTLSDLITRRRNSK